MDIGGILNGVWDSAKSLLPESEEEKKKKGLQKPIDLTAPSQKNDLQSYMVPSSSLKSPAAAQAVGDKAGIGNTNFLLNMGNAGMNNPLSTGGTSKFTPAMLSKEGALNAAGNSAGMQAASTQALGNIPESVGSSEPKHSVDYERMMKALQSVVPNERLEAQFIGGGGGSGGFRPGFNFDRKLYENPLLTKSYGDLYFSPGSR